jgi:thioredoxin reductase (NADPH)
MSRYLIDQIGVTGNIRVRTRSVLERVEGSGRVERVTLASVDGGAAHSEPIDAVFVMIGARPHTEWLPPTVLRDRRGFVLAGRELTASEEFRRVWKEKRAPFPLETSVPGIFAAGDVRAGAINRVASAVGEGAMAVRLVHEYLALT